MSNNYYRLVGAWHSNDRRVEAVPEEQKDRFGNLHRFHQTANQDLDNEALKEIQFHIDALARIKATLEKGRYDYRANECGPIPRPPEDT
jgi:hypothetical protein